MGLYSLVLWTHWATGIHGIWCVWLEHTACGALVLLFSPGSPCGVPAARSGWYSVLGHLRKALSARGSPCGAATAQCNWCSVLGHPCGADALALHISGCLAAPQPGNAVGALFLATFGVPMRTSGITESLPLVQVIERCGGRVPPRGRSRATCRKSPEKLFSGSLKTASCWHRHGINTSERISICFSAVRVIGQLAGEQTFHPKDRGIFLLIPIQIGEWQFALRRCMFLGSSRDVCSFHLGGSQMRGIFAES